MISYLRGKLLELNDNGAVIDVNGVGYEVVLANYSSVRTIALGSEVALAIHLVMREDSVTLYGFADSHQRDFFRLLIKVNGVGPKLALTLLQFSPSELSRCFAQNDLAMLQKIPGIGAKTAQRLMVEMKDKTIIFGETVSKTARLDNLAHQDALNALIALGYKAYDAMQALDAYRDEELTNGELVKRALKKLAGSRG